MFEGMSVVVNVMLSLISVMSPPPVLCNLSARTVVQLCTFGCVCFRDERGFLNCDDICMCVVNKQFELLECGRPGPWQLLRKYGCPEKFTIMMESLHTGMMVNVRYGGEVSDTFAITNSHKQWCVLDPTPFSIFLSAMLEEAFRDM